MSQGEERQALVSHPVRLLCGYLGISRQGYYGHVDRSLELDVLRSSIVFYAQELRTSLLKAGIRILYDLCRRKYADQFTIGRDQCYAPTDYAFAVANAQGRPTPITITTSMKTFSTQRAS